MREQRTIEQRLTHYSKKPLGPLQSKVQTSTQRGWGARPKPYGLWLSVDGEDDWKSWCESEQWGLETLTHAYRVVLGKPEALLWLSTPDEVLEFGERYDKPVEGCGIIKGYIDWPKVAEAYAGIVIAPYQYPLRLDERTHWYYGWDCASGCVWDVGAIASVSCLSQEKDCEQAK